MNAFCSEPSSFFLKMMDANTLINFKAAFQPKTECALTMCVALILLQRFTNLLSCWETLRKFPGSTSRNMVNNTN